MDASCVNGNRPGNYGSTIVSHMHDERKWNNSIEGLTLNLQKSEIGVSSLDSVLFRIIITFYLESEGLTEDMHSLY